MNVFRLYSLKATIHKRLAIDLIAALLLWLYLYTAASKLADRETFEYVLGRSVLIGKYASLLSWILPVVELTVVAALFLPVYRQTGFWLSAILLFLFTSYLIFMISVEKNLPCACGGVLEMLGWKQHIVFNITAFLLSVLGGCLSVGKNNMHSNSPP